jgi:aminoglycoside phosphotransferase (APT) family kinase protein
VVDALGRAGAPVPAVVAIDPSARAVGRPCFVMEWVEGRSVPDAWPNAYHAGWFLDAGADAQRAIWDSFHDALAAVHRVELGALATAYDGPRGAVAVLDYWRDALLDLVDASAVPRHLAVFDWLAANVPPSADAPLSLCMGDARLVNAIVDGTEVAALVDFEVASVGNPIADIAYSLFLERSHGHTAPLPGLPSEEETWTRWSAATGRELVDLDYWMAFGATIIVVTATRASVMWGPPDSFSEDHQGLLPLWESVVQEPGA